MVEIINSRWFCAFSFTRFHMVQIVLDSFMDLVLDGFVWLR